LTTGTKSLEELARELPPDLRQKVRDYAGYLLAGPERPRTVQETDGPGLDAEVTLRQITAETVRAICQLSDTLEPPKKYMVAPNAVSIAQAYFEPKAWFRAVYAGETPVGFVMLYDDPDEPAYFLWRLMIAGHHHGKGYGRRAVELLVEYVRTRPGADALEVSCCRGAGSPEGFYQQVGFRHSGKMYGQEVGLIMDLKDGEA
jgi:diamine N-acetyltransferase